MCIGYKCYVYTTSRIQVLFVYDESSSVPRQIAVVSYTNSTCILYKSHLYTTSVVVYHDDYLPLLMCS